MMSTPRIWVDFMKADDKRRLILTTRGTLEDLEEHQLELREGLALRVYSDDLDDKGHADNLLADGVVHYDADAKRWVLEIDWNAITHESSTRPR
jgi:hypothetical protein